MKRIIIGALIALTTFTTQAQTDEALFLDIKIGTRLGGEKSDLVTLGAGLNIQGGLGYMVNKFWGFKGDLGFNTIKTKSILNPGNGDRSAIVRSSLQGILDIAEIANFGIENFGLNIHSGFGFATIQNPSWKAAQTGEFNDPWIKGNDDVINIIFGLNPQYRINDRFHLDVDYSFNMLAKQDVTFDTHNNVLTNGGMTNYSTLSFGITYSFIEKVKMSIHF